LSRARQIDDQIEEIVDFTREYEKFGIVSSGWQGIHQNIISGKGEVSLGEIRVENQIPEDLEIYADPIIRKVFTTLMENTIRHGGDTTSKIRFSCVKREGQLYLIYEDNGMGVPSEEKEHIFYQGYGKNTGIGLFLAKEILSITGLSIRECGVPGEGARFEIRVPEGKWQTID
ncbi:MAG: HAMP domain-containing sensor histidine kinase, partial [Methanobacteriota archaeon]